MRMCRKALGSASTHASSQSLDQRERVRLFLIQFIPNGLTSTTSSTRILEFNYQSIGSGGGIRQVLAGTVDFGASDGPMTDEQLGQAKTKILHFPTVLGADVPTYNIPGINQELNFTPEALAGIYLGKITKWNDPAITGPNKG